MREPIEIFFSYAHEDESLMDAVRRQLAVFERQGRILKWHDRKITAGTEWQGRIDQRLRSAHIILLFVSPYFFESDYAYDAEMTEALRRHDSGEARVIPIILRPCAWETSPVGRLQVLPQDGRPLTRWRNRDEGCLNIAQGVIEAVTELESHAAVPRPAGPNTARADEEAAARLHRLKRLLGESWYVFRSQRTRIRRLHALLDQRLGTRVPADVGYDETFFLLYDDMNEEEKELFRIIRTITNGRMYALNAEIRQLASARPSITPSRRSPATDRLDRKLDQLKLHLDLWFDRYETVFSTSERRSVVFLDDLKVPGVSFPDGLDDAVEEVLAELQAPPPN